jgi:hypothetical protein
MINTVTITGTALAITLPKGGALPLVPLVTVEGQPSPIPFNVTLGGMFGLTLEGVTLNGKTVDVQDFGTAWAANSAMAVTLNLDANGVSQQTDFATV